MNIIKKTIPIGIQFISQWKEYSLPKGEHCIVDKGVTGCGYTEYCLQNNENIILCSPRKLLLENKEEQHKNDDNILYLENNIVGFSDVLQIETKIKNHIALCEMNQKPVKFMVTYDSLHYISEYLIASNLEKDYIFVIDEFQSIFLDSYFKAEVENSFVEYLQDCTNVIYLSATPMLEEYLDRLDEFNSLNMYILDWSKTGYVDTVKFQRDNVKSLSAQCNKIIQNYLSGNFPIIIDEKKNIVQSKEAVFYFNSVTDIIRCISKNKLTPVNTRIICSKTEENKKKLKRVGFNFGKVPLKGECNPMFMFCTSSVYIGVDFYSDSASSYVFADPNIKCLALDISMDLPQIVGRQRNKNNPFKNNITIFYKTLNPVEKYSDGDFKKLQEERRKRTAAGLDMYYQSPTELGKSVAIDKLKAGIIVSKYSGDYISISRKTGKPVYNKLIEVAHERSWVVAQKDYQDSINVTRALFKAGFESEQLNSSQENYELDNFLSLFNLCKTFEERLKVYCEFRDKIIGNKLLIDKLRLKVDSKFENYYNFYGTDGCRANSYKEAELKKKLNNSISLPELSKHIESEFKIGDRLSKKEIKSRIEIIYSKLKIEKTPKATDLEEWFEIRSCKISNKATGKRDMGFEIIGRK